MKKILILFILVLIIPSAIVYYSVKKEDEIYYNLTSDITVRLKREHTGEVEEISFEEYIVGVVAGEMPATFEFEALKAQAVAARSYALVRISGSKTYDLVDSTNHQVYKDEDQLKERWKSLYTSNINKIRKAVSETRGEYMVYEGNVIDAMYFSTSNGYTENSEYRFNYTPYLRSVESPWDKLLSPHYKKTTTHNLDEVLSILGINGSNLDIDIMSRTDSQRVDKININNKVFDGYVIRDLLGLRSSDFDMEVRDNQIIITTFGWGHGVGMSQYGADGMAKEGYNYEEILKHYYTGVEIIK